MPLHSAYACVGLGNFSLFIDDVTVLSGNAPILKASAFKRSLRGLFLSATPCRQIGVLMHAHKEAKPS
jgi:hypothetical protein